MDLPTRDEGGLMARFSIAVRIVFSGISAIAAASRRENPFLSMPITSEINTPPMGGIFIKRDTFCDTPVLGVLRGYKNLGSHRGLVSC